MAYYGCSKIRNGFSDCTEGHKVAIGTQEARALAGLPALSVVYCTHRAVAISGLEATDQASFGGTFLLVEDLLIEDRVVYQQAGGGSNYLYYRMSTGWQWAIGPDYINGLISVYSRDDPQGSTCPDEHKSWAYRTTTAWMYDMEINCTAIAIGALLQLLSLVN